MSSHHPAQAEQLNLEAPARARSLATPNGAQNGLSARFYDQQTGQTVEASPVTAVHLADYQAMRTRRAGATRLAGPAPTIGDWVITQGNGATPLQADLVIGPDFLRRFYPADARARELLRRLDQTPGGAGAGDPSVAFLRASAIPDR
jgi:hypothetical protein